MEQLLLLINNEKRTEVNNWTNQYFFVFFFLIGPRYRKPKQPKVKGENDEKRPRTAFSMEQLARLKVISHDFCIINSANQ